MNLVEVAKDIAQEAHKGQKRKNSGLPYITHVENVVNKLIEHGHDDENIIAAAWLHDTLEDGSEEMKQRVYNEMPQEVIDIIKAVTITGDKVASIRNIFANGPEESKLIKLSDRIDNLSDGKQLGTKWINKYKGSTDVIKAGAETMSGSLVDEFMSMYNKTYNEYLSENLLIEGFWLHKETGKRIRVKEHGTAVIESPEKFGVSKKEVEKILSDKPYNPISTDQGSARDDILNLAFQKGWIRVRSSHFEFFGEPQKVAKQILRKFQDDFGYATWITLTDRKSEQIWETSFGDLENKIEDMTDNPIGDSPYETDAEARQRIRNRIVPAGAYFESFSHKLKKILDSNKK